MWREIVFATALAATGLEAGSVIRLKSRAIDTSALAPSPMSRDREGAEIAGPIHKLVQFEAPPSAYQMSVLEAAGARVLAYVPDDAVLVVIDARAPLHVDGMRWAAPLEPADKISPDLDPAASS